MHSDRTLLLRHMLSFQISFQFAWLLILSKHCFFPNNPLDLVLSSNKSSLFNQKMDLQSHCLFLALDKLIKFTYRFARDNEHAISCPIVRDARDKHLQTNVSVLSATARNSLPHRIIELWSWKRPQGSSRQGAVKLATSRDVS